MAKSTINGCKPSGRTCPPLQHSLNTGPMSKIVLHLSLMLVSYMRSRQYPEYQVWTLSGGDCLCQMLSHLLEVLHTLGLGRGWLLSRSCRRQDMTRITPWSCSRIIQWSLAVPWICVNLVISPVWDVRCRLFVNYSSFSPSESHMGSIEH